MLFFFKYDRRLHQQSVSIMVCFNKSDSQNRALLNLVVYFFPEYQSINKLYIFLPHVCKLFFCHISVDMQD